MTEPRFTIDKGNDSEFRIRDRDKPSWPWGHPGGGYVVGHTTGQPWHHWIKEIASTYCSALNRGDVKAP